MVIIDGLDECGDDRTQLRVLSAIVSSYQQFPSFPLRFLICSRPESWIKEAFRRTPLSRYTKHILLDESFHPNRDIKHFYLHAFKEIRERPECARIKFTAPWPSEADLESLIQKSSGQFVYATTAAKFIGLPCSDPIKQLYYILSYDPETHTSDTSFSELDRLYHIALSISPNHQKLRSVLAAIFVLRPRATPSPEFIELLLDLPTGDVDLTLRYMHSVLIIQGGDVAITAYHTSFTDFIYDRSRSREFYVNRGAYGNAFAIRWLRTLTHKIKTNPDIILYPDSTPTVQSKLFKGWFNFCLTGTRPTKELLIERDNLLRAILRAFPGRQRLVATLPSLILLPVHGLGWVPFQAVGDLILGRGQVHVSSVTKFLETCQLVMRTRKGEQMLRPFFRAFLCDPGSQEFYIDVPKHHDLLAQQWIKALVPSNQPTSRCVPFAFVRMASEHHRVFVSLLSAAGSDSALRTLWNGWADFCCGIERPSDELLSDLENMDLLVVAVSIALMHPEQDQYSSDSMTIRPLKAVISWLTGVVCPFVL
ncbi:hypothetical protein AAF712_014140 [Marasmius tenuissimus]|uniref:NACHT domain-containing protein n=1 Tax=Marasmius tenuissimus TaxID=585030 RepID=A0ABR2ZCX4_9AGAR